MTSLSISRRCLLSFITIFPILLTQVASACIAQWEEPEESKLRAQVVVQALIVHSEAPHHTFHHLSYPYKVTIESIERGNLTKKPSLLTYEELLMHRRGDMTVCPFNHGSGIEKALKPNSLYRIYLRSETDPEILFAEEISPQASTIKDFTFSGTAKEIKAVPLDEPSQKKWIVTFSVDKVTQGSFLGQTFSVSVHSPARSGLEVGRQYQVQAKWNGTGYDVDEFQGVRE